MVEYCQSVKRSVHVINLDPAAEHFSYPVEAGEGGDLAEHHNIHIKYMNYRKYCVYGSIVGLAVLAPTNLVKVLHVPQCLIYIHANKASLSSPVGSILYVVRSKARGSRVMPEHAQYGITERGEILCVLIEVFGLGA